jgi:hypothetical protein
MKQLNTNKCVLLAVLCLSFAVHGQADDTDHLQQQGLQLINRFAGSLKPQLQQAIESGGLEQAIDVCSSQAPAIAKALSQETGWQLKRVSLKPRNPQSAVADAWEDAILRQFERRQAAGESPLTLVYSEIQNHRFRLLKAQAVEPLCLNCHGKQLTPEVERALKKHYPQDQATGYSLGEIRGAFSLSKEL